MEALCSLNDLKKKVIQKITPFDYASHLKKRLQLRVGGKVNFKNLAFQPFH